MKTSKNTEKGDFDQRLECALPKPWLKYTTEDQEFIKFDKLRRQFYRSYSDVTKFGVETKVKEAMLFVCHKKHHFTVLSPWERSE